MSKHFVWSCFLLTVLNVLTGELDRELPNFSSVLNKTILKWTGCIKILCPLVIGQCHSSQQSYSHKSAQEDLDFLILSLPAGTTEEQAGRQACWPADVHHGNLFLEPCCFYRLTALKYGPNPFTVTLAWLLPESVHIQASEHPTVHQSSHLKGYCLWPVFENSVSALFSDPNRGTNTKLYVMTAWKSFLLKGKIDVQSFSH